MASIKFRFTTECEMTLHGSTYEDIYLQFKDFIHGDQRIANRANIGVFPPESVQVFFDLESSGERHEIPQFKGDYQQDIANRCKQDELERMPIPMRQQASSLGAVIHEEPLYWFGS
jgi:hypothetical protein